MTTPARRLERVVDVAPKRPTIGLAVVKFAWLRGNVPCMGLDLNRLHEIRLFQAFDVDESGRVLAGSDHTGSTQLIEIAGDDSLEPLVRDPRYIHALADVASGRSCESGTWDRQHASVRDK